MNPEETNTPLENENQDSPVIPSTHEEYVPVPAPEPVGIDTSIVQMACQKIKAELAKAIVGQEELIDLVLIALFSGGHVLLEGVPGIAKTLLSKLLAKTISINFNRIQFTPDLMPTDVVGTNVYNLNNSNFEFKAGPIFSNIILIDEINRAPAKTQSALFEVMEEYQVTIDGKRYLMSLPFFVIATQNPIEQEGTYKLPEAQLDRFIFKLNMVYPNFEEEKAILHRFKNDFKMKTQEEVRPTVTGADILAARQIIEAVFIKDELIDYIAKIVNHTRNNGDLFLGASPRASLSIMKTAKATAAIQGRGFVTPDDIRSVTYPVLNHRLILTPEREMEGYDIKDVIDEIIKKVEIPR